VLPVLTPEQRLELFRAIPSEFVVNGQSLTIPIRYASQWENDTWPCIILEYTSLSEKSYDFINLVYNKTNQQMDEITFTSGTSVYSLSMTLVWIIDEVQGFLLDRLHTFVNGVDYQLTGDTIEWLGADEPDNGSYFYVTFKSKWIRILKGGEKFDILSVNVLTKDYGDVDEGTYINGIVLADSIAGQLHKYFEYSMTMPDNTVNVTEATIVNLDALVEGEYQRRRQFDVKIRHVELVETLVESVEEIDQEVDIE